MDWQPSASLATLRQRSALLRAARDFFAARGMLEVETPALVAAAVTDPHLENLRVQLVEGRTHFLHTSPEFHMKRLLAAGAPDIWQLGKVFRGGEAGRRHEPEFTLIEWYRRDRTLAELAGETCALLATLAHAAEQAGAAPTISRQPPVHWTYSALFQDSLGLDPLTVDAPALEECARSVLGARADADLCARLGHETSLWLDLLMTHVVSERLAETGICVVTGYPAAQAALARIDPANPAVAERFEVFCHGIEVANGYRELTDPTEQRQRFRNDRDFRARLARPDVLPDEELLAALEHGLPDCAGVAVGFDRVVMVLLGLSRIQESMSFPVLGARLQ